MAGQSLKINKSNQSLKITKSNQSLSLKASATTPSRGRKKSK